MKRLFFAFMLLCGAFAFLQAVSAQSPEYSQSRLDRQVRREILRLPYYGVFDAIGYTVNGNTVTLNGAVVRPLTKSEAGDAVRDINGVTNVVNNIEVLPLSPNDDRIRRRVLQTLSGQGGSLYRYFLGANPSIRIVVQNGRVTLEGYVDNRGDANRANILTRGISGIFGVTNNLKVFEEPR